METFLITILLMILIATFLLVVFLLFTIVDDIVFEEAGKRFLRSLPSRWKRWRNAPKYNIGDTVGYEYCSLNYTCKVASMMWYNEDKWMYSLEVTQIHGKRSRNLKFDIDKMMYKEYVNEYDILPPFYQQREIAIDSILEED